MSDVRVPIWGLCPFRSPVVPREASVLASPSVPQEPLQALGPCLYAGCGLWTVTKIVDGKPVDGACSIRYAAEKQAEAAGALGQIALALLGASEGKANG
jgi:hypothetical protein